MSHQGILGVLFDSTCSLNDHVSKICKSINYNLYSIREIWKYLDTLTAEKMKKMFYNIMPGLLQQSPLWHKRLQYIPATDLPEQCHPDVVLVWQIWSYHSSPERPTLAACWGKNQIQGATAHLWSSYKAPAYIFQLLSLYTPTRPLWVETNNLLRVPRSCGRVWQALLCICRFIPLEPSPYTCYICLLWCLSLKMSNQIIYVMITCGK